MNGKKEKIMIAIALSFALMFLAGCQSDAQTGALIGGLAGAGVGQLAGGDTESTLIGAAIGAGSGYFIGNESDKKKTQTHMVSLKEDINTHAVNVVNSNGSIVQVKVKRYGVGYIGPRGEYYQKLPTSEQLRPVYGF
ncbi:MAG: glycine zipper domain-containing protein [Planctomycetota bacterium]